LKRGFRKYCQKHHTSGIREAHSFRKSLARGTKGRGGRGGQREGKGGRKRILQQEGALATVGHELKKAVM